MMTKLLALGRKAGSFIAGLLIGLSIVDGAFAVTDMESGGWQTVLIFGAPVILVLGLAVQVLVTARPGYWHVAGVAEVPPGSLAAVCVPSIA
jgi:hypothetical protein